MGDELKKNIRNDIIGNIVVGKYILSILVKKKSRHLITGENHGIRIGFQSFYYTLLSKGRKDSTGMCGRTNVPYFVFVFLIS